jgi:hypothetical protein
MVSASRLLSEIKIVVLPPSSTTACNPLMEPQVADIAGFIEWLILLLTEETGLNFFISLIYCCKVRFINQ